MRYILENFLRRHQNNSKFSTFSCCFSLLFTITVQVLFLQTVWLKQTSVLFVKNGTAAPGNAVRQCKNKQQRVQCKICTLPSAQQMEPDASKPLFTVHLKGNQFVLFQFAFVFHSLFITFICHFCHFIELPRAAVRILSNMTFLFVSLSYTAESAIVTAFITFIPKFIESQFGIPASNASIYTGKALPMSVTLQGLLFFG